MEKAVWSFTRGNDCVELRRQQLSPGVALTVTLSGVETDRYTFDHLIGLIHFQNEYERWLLAHGWSFIDFVGNRRSGHDRRQHSRAARERRQFTSDAMLGPSCLEILTPDNRHRGLIARRAR